MRRKVWQHARGSRSGCCCSRETQQRCNGTAHKARSQQRTAVNLAKGPFTQQAFQLDGAVPPVNSGALHAAPHLLNQLCRQQQQRQQRRSMQGCCRRSVCTRARRCKGNRQAGGGQAARARQCRGNASRSTAQPGHCMSAASPSQPHRACQSLTSWWSPGAWSPCCPQTGPAPAAPRCCPPCCRRHWRQTSASWRPTYGACAPASAPAAVAAAGEREHRVSGAGRTQLHPPPAAAAPADAMHARTCATRAAPAMLPAAARCRPPQAQRLQQSARRCRRRCCQAAATT